MPISKIKGKVKDGLQAKADDLEMKLAIETAKHDAFQTFFTKQIIALHDYYNKK
jgi:hypothetical protein